MYIKNIIIGAGPAGLQLGSFFQTHKIEYKIFERNSGVASFFTKYPLSGKLISINKKYTGSEHPDFNLRHDWNSLLSDKNLLFNEYSDEYYPNRADLVDYLTDFSIECELNIQFDSNVFRVQKEGKGYRLLIGDTEYECDRLIIATGLSTPVLPNIIHNYQKEIKHYGEYDKDAFIQPQNLEMYKNKSVLLIGGGNASFELGNVLNPFCSSVTILGRRPKNWAVSSHYTGDIRAVYLPFMDTFLLKSLNAIEHTERESILRIDQETDTDKYSVSYQCGNQSCTVKHPLFGNTISEFDHIIFCTGWKFDASIFEFELPLTNNKKYPEIQSNYESVTNENLFFIGSLMHARDYKKSSGGFIHGFRYLIRTFMNMNYGLEYDIHRFVNIEEIAKHIMYKINFTSPMYQMYGQLCDFLYFDIDVRKFVYYNNIHTHMVSDNRIIWNGAIGVLVTLEYGKDQVQNIHQLGKKVSGLGTESRSTLLHPVLTVIRHKEKIDIVHFDEDLYANFQDDSYFSKIVRTLRMFF